MSVDTRAFAEEERAQAKRNAVLANAIALWKRTEDVLDAENKAKERKLRQIVRKRLSGTDAASILSLREFYVDGLIAFTYHTMVHADVSFFIAVFFDDVILSVATACIGLLHNRAQV